MIGRIVIAALAASACTPVEMRGTPPVADAAPGCAIAGLTPLVGKRASDARADEMLATSGAKTLRWIAPNMAVTMDYRADRLNVHVDGKGRIAKFGCS